MQLRWRLVRWYGRGGVDHHHGKMGEYVCQQVLNTSTGLAWRNVIGDAGFAQELLPLSPFRLIAVAHDAFG